MKKVRKFTRRKILFITLILMVPLVIGILMFTGVIWPNYLFAAKYPVKGIDVSSYQYQIDWSSVARTGQYQFVFIKATEGRTYQDAYFQANWRGAKAHGILRGAYHYISST